MPQRSPDPRRFEVLGAVLSCVQSPRKAERPGPETQTHPSNACCPSPPQVFLYSILFRITRSARLCPFPPSFCCLNRSCLFLIVRVSPCLTSRAPCGLSRGLGALGTIWAGGRRLFWVDRACGRNRLLWGRVICHNTVKMQLLCLICSCCPGALDLTC